MPFLTIANVLSILFLSCRIDAFLYLPVSALLFLFGMCGVFRKCGMKPWQALIPCLREVRTGEAAGADKDGRIAAVLRALILLPDLFRLFFSPGLIPELILRFMGILFRLFLFIYMLRICLALNKTFGRKPQWIVLWAFVPFIPAILFGWGKRFRPAGKRIVKTDASGYTSGVKASEAGGGLTVNLEEQAVGEFFKKRVLLRDIHMQLQPGRMVLLLGGTGTGKTVFLKAVNGYEKARAKVVLNGRDVYDNFREMQYDIGFVPKQDLLRDSDTVYQTLMDAAVLHLPAGFTKADRENRVEEMLEIFSLNPIRDSLAGSLSGGQRKRLAIAAEFISNPALFILDEPDRELDSVTAQELFQQLRRIAHQGKIVIVVTLTPDRVADLFDDVIVLANDAGHTGRLAWFGSVEQARVFFGEEKMEKIVRLVSRREEGGEDRADEFILKYAEVQHA